jgi:hypothetical protein
MTSSWRRAISTTVTLSTAAQMGIYAVNNGRICVSWLGKRILERARSLQIGTNGYLYLYEVLRPPLRAAAPWRRARPGYRP